MNILICYMPKTELRMRSYDAMNIAKYFEDRRDALSTPEPAGVEDGDGGRRGRRWPGRRRSWPDGGAAGGVDAGHGQRSYGELGGGAAELRFWRAAAGAALRCRRGGGEAPGGGGWRVGRGGRIRARRARAGSAVMWGACCHVARPGWLRAAVDVSGRGWTCPAGARWIFLGFGRADPRISRGWCINRHKGS